MFHLDNNDEVIVFQKYWITKIFGSNAASWIFEADLIPDLYVIKRTTYLFIGTMSPL